ncbi:MAG TPA: alginate lyase family protein [Pyrinomonadaceae bacterium]|nr:alginate lyase family protein [Pyrinomonadaceae bacterium]
MSVTRKIKRALRGRVSPRAALLEAGRRVFVALRRRRERATLDARNGGEPPKAGLAQAFERMSGAELLAHFRTRATPGFFAEFDAAESKRRHAPSEALRRHAPSEAFNEPPAQAAKSGGVAFSGGVVDFGALLREARAIVSAHRWPLLGYGTLDFGEEIDWLRDPASGGRWPLVFHGDVRLARGDGSDVRVLWELNRLGHLLTLARAYAVGREESFAGEFFRQVESWSAQNPLGFGPNWACSMEVALRATNLLAAFQIFRGSRALDERRLASMLALFDAHATHVRRNLEFSFVATGNHYLSDVVGLLWLGVLLPELRAAEGWRAFGLREVLREMDKQVFDDGADCEASTGYHRFVTELFLYTFILCRANGIEIDERHWQRLRSMLEYLRAYLRPDGRAPLVGDTDGGQFMPLVRRDADDHAYLSCIGAVLFGEPRFKLSGEAPEELFLLLGAEGVRSYSELKNEAALSTLPAHTPQSASTRSSQSVVFERAGACVLREGDLYLMLSASGAGMSGRGSHAHNDALSVEVSARGTSFVADAGTYVYTSDLRARQQFRSTAYHSTVEVDGEEQNTSLESAPFFIGDEARPRIVRFESDAALDVVVAEHHGYERLKAGPITHRRAVTFDKREGFWLVEDTLAGAGRHDFRFIFHAAPGRDVRVLDGSAVEILESESGERLVVASLSSLGGVELEPRWSSRGYGSKVATVAAVWTLRASAPYVARWLLAPAGAGEDALARLELTRARLVCDRREQTFE